MSETLTAYPLCVDETRSLKPLFSTALKSLNMENDSEIEVSVVEAADLMLMGDCRLPAPHMAKSGLILCQCSGPVEPEYVHLRLSETDTTVPTGRGGGSETLFVASVEQSF